METINPVISRLAGLICAATRIGAETLERSHFRELPDYYDQEVSRRNWHPSLTEALADFAAVQNPTAALPYYRLALEQARELHCETSSILIAMAVALLETGQQEQAEACVLEGRTEAIRQGDAENVREAERVMKEMGI